jgi:DNA (cytosine-5)-methyltransferase 1
VIDLETFAGPGGWDTGAAALGIRPVGIELDAAACSTRAAAGHLTIRADVAEYPVEHLAGKVRGQIHSPPCTTFSAAGDQAGNALLEILAGLIRDMFAGRNSRLNCRAAMTDTLTASDWAADLDAPKRAAKIKTAVLSASLVAEPARFIAACHPEWVALEQVPAVLPLWQVYAAELRKMGYSAWTGKLNAADYGVPQTRERAILIASRVRHVCRPEPTHYDTRKGLQLWGTPWVSMAEALGYGATVRPSPSVTAGGTATGGAEPLAKGGRNALAAEKNAGRWVSMDDALRLTNEHPELRGTPENGSSQRQRLLADDLAGAADVRPPLGMGASERTDPEGTGGGSPVPGALVLQPGSHGTGDEPGEHPARDKPIGRSRAEGEMLEGALVQDQERRQALLPDMPAGTPGGERADQGAGIHGRPEEVPEGSRVHAREHAAESSGTGRKVAGPNLPDVRTPADEGLQSPQESGARSHLDGQWMLRWSRGEGMLDREGRGGRRDHPLDEPSPTITSAGSKVGANLSWVLHTNRDQRSDGTRQTADPTTAPAPALTAKSGGQWIVKSFRNNNNNNNACERPIDEPAGTLFFGQRSNWAAWTVERPATTVQGDPRLGRPGHKDRDKGERQFEVDSVRITVEEAAALQSFPAGYPWQGTKTKRFEQVGNAVPPLLAIAVLGVATGADWQPAAERYAESCRLVAADVTATGGGEAA